MKTLSPLYLIVGDDPLLVQEAADTVRTMALEQGATRRTLHATSDFDWDQLLDSGANMSLFGDRELIEVNIPGGKPGPAGARVMRELAEQPPESDILMIVAADVRRGDINKAAWAKAISAAGKKIQAWSPPESELPRWITDRMRSMGLIPDQGAVALLADRVEGNLVAAAQEMEKLLLLQGPGPVDENAIRESVADSARYDVFQLTDAALAGRADRALRILRGLREEDTAAPLVCWALARDVLDLSQIAAAGRGRKPNIWPQRLRQLEPVARRLGADRCRALLVDVTRADAMSKGQLRGDAWAQFASVLAGIAGKASTTRRLTA